MIEQNLEHYNRLDEYHPIEHLYWRTKYLKKSLTHFYAVKIDGWIVSIRQNTSE